MELDVRGLKSPTVTELYITATPTPGRPAAEQGREVFQAIQSLLGRHQARLCQERVFAPAHATDTLRALRAQAYGPLDDAVEPTWLTTGRPDDALAAVQVHAVSGLPQPRILSAGDGVQARAFELNGHKWVIASGLTAPEAGSVAGQARGMFEKAAALLEQVGADLRAVARTWIFMDDILAWYGQFNQVRTGFFLERGVIGPAITENRLPASTGIGISPAGQAKCALDLFAVVGGADCIHRYHAAGKQLSAFDYGSAFARSAVAKSPAGQAVFVSGTAAIDTAGRTCCVGDIRGQLRMTLDNVVAVLRDMSCRPDEVVQAIAYCATPEVEKAFLGSFADELPWPWVTLIGDVCRSDLLFEVEVTACPGARRVQKS